MVPHDDDDDSSRDYWEPPQAPRGAAAPKAAPAGTSGKTYISEADDPRKFAAYRNEFSRLTVDQLTARLKINRMKTSGSKGELVERCADAAINGVAPQCPICRQGYLRRDRATAEEVRSRGLQMGAWVYHCPGRFDDRLHQKVPCPYFAEDVYRAPWKN